MLDLRDLRDDPDRVRQSQVARGEDPSAVDAVLSADERHRIGIHPQMVGVHHTARQHEGVAPRQLVRATHP